MINTSATLHRILLFLLLFLMSSGGVRAQQEPSVVLSSDRTIIYIDRLQLHGDESLMDVLLMYPEQLVSGYDDMLDNYQLRMENVVMSCDIRQFLTSTPAKACTKIQVCENPGVLKGKPGMGGVIDINMRHNTEGTHGLVNLEAATSTDLSPQVNINYGKTDSAGYSTDLYATTSADFHYPRAELNINQYADIHLKQQMGNRDRLLVYLRQSYEQDISYFTEQNYLARARYFHTFNDIGTELLALAGYQYYTIANQPAPDMSQNVRRIQTGTQLYVLELNTPIPFAKGLQLCAGWEMDVANHRYHFSQDIVKSLIPFDTLDNYSVINNDFYLQLDYTIGPVKFSLGDRLSYYNYGMRSLHNKSSHNDLRNFFIASIAATITKEHQLQAGYYRRFINPSLLMVLPVGLPTDPAEEIKADIVRLAYTYTHNRVNLNFGAKYTHMVEENAHTVQVNVAASWMTDWLILTGGASLTHTIASKGIPYGCIRLSPTFRLPYQWRIAAQVIWYSSNAPERALTSWPVYGQVGIEKCIDNILKLSLQWHSPYNRNLNSAVFSAKVLF